MGAGVVAKLIKLGVGPVREERSFPFTKDQKLFYLYTTQPPCNGREAALMSFSKKQTNERSQEVVHCTSRTKSPFLRCCVSELSVVLPSSLRFACR